MSPKNREVQVSIQDNREVFSALRRSDIAYQLKARMLSKGLRSVDIAERLGVSEANVSRWFSGSQNLSLDTMYAIADALEERLCVLLRAKDEASTLIQLEDEILHRDWERQKGKGSLPNLSNLSEYQFVADNPAANDGFISEFKLERTA